ncbi:hypothetical protein CNMCM5793_003372 [Aspergillus hiratsukae]|uniref:Uncharacterized protein n=1 Tax=Aspergillus hiratsukae TaxID=1194566 RepID=A0A8H6PEX0_9EURO|nr:hypothetical protein CNMCM5793_003372 [Aspergillus hiratsukae]
MRSQRYTQGSRFRVACALEAVVGRETKPTGSGYRLKDLGDIAAAVAMELPYSSARLLRRHGGTGRDWFEPMHARGFDIQVIADIDTFQFERRSDPSAGSWNHRTLQGDGSRLKLLEEEINGEREPVMRYKNITGVRLSW